MLWYCICYVFDTILYIANMYYVIYNPDIYFTYICINNSVRSLVEPQGEKA